MVPVNHFEENTMAHWHPTLLHQVIYAQAFLAHKRDTNHSSDIAARLLAIIHQDLVYNPKSKYSWAQQVHILLFKTIIGEDSKDTQLERGLH